MNIARDCTNCKHKYLTFVKSPCGACGNNFSKWEADEMTAYAMELEAELAALKSEGIKAGQGRNERAYTRAEIDYFINLAGAVEVLLEPLVTAQPGDEVDEDGRLPLAVIVEKVAEYVRRDARNTLHLLMTNFSEEAYCAGWMEGLEQACKDMLAGRITSYGILDGSDFAEWKQELTELHNLAGGWWEWSDDAHGEVFVPDVLEAPHG